MQLMVCSAGMSEAGPRILPYPSRSFEKHSYLSRFIDGVTESTPYSANSLLFDISFK